MAFDEKFCYMAGVALVLGGCGTIDVYENDNSTALKGVQFYTKVPVLTQETKLLKNELLVRITVSGSTNNGEHKLSVYPSDGPLALSPAGRDVVNTIAKEYGQRAKMQTFDKAQKVAEEAIDAMKSQVPAAADSQIVSNTWSMTMIVGPVPYYINTHQPLIGTANPNFELSADGTLSKASATVTDDTFKTLLGLFPISAKIAQHWSVPTPSSKSEASGSDVSFETSIEDQKGLYTVRKVTNIGKGATLDSYLPSNMPPLTLEDAYKGGNGVQLVSVETPDDKSKGKADTKSYQFQGTVTPPATSDTAVGAGVSATGGKTTK